MVLFLFVFLFALVWFWFVFSVQRAELSCIPEVRAFFISISLLLSLFVSVLVALDHLICSSSGDPVRLTRRGSNAITIQLTRHALPQVTVRLTRRGSNAITI